MFDGSCNVILSKLVYDRALRGREKALGPEHTSTLTTVYISASSTQLRAGLATPRLCTTGHS